MRVYVRSCVCVYVCMCVCVYVCMCVCEIQEYGSGWRRSVRTDACPKNEADQPHEARSALESGWLSATEQILTFTNDLSKTVEALKGDDLNIALLRRPLPPPLPQADREQADHSDRTRVLEKKSCAGLRRGASKLTGCCKNT